MSGGSSAIDKLKTLDLPSCSRSKALRIWKWIFLTDYFGLLLPPASAVITRWPVPP